MIKTQSLLYVAVLVLAFVAGLLGTLAATRYVTAVGHDQAPGLERPALAPIPATAHAVVPTIDC